ncbi:hypothetical protein OAD49_02550 [Flavobacteriaceae bacterium]|nr:hypothetical protein [Flavobacteriaceae bacterium]
MKKKKLNILDIRDLHRLQFIFYVGDNYNPTKRSEKSERDIFLFSNDKVLFYKEKDFECFQCAPVLSKILNDNIDE